MTAVIAKLDLRQAMRTLLVLLIKVFCSFAAAGNASAQSSLTATTIQNDPTALGSLDHPRVMPIRSKRAPTTAISSIKTMFRF